MEKNPQKSKAKRTYQYIKVKTTQRWITSGDMPPELQKPVLHTYIATYPFLHITNSVYAWIQGRIFKFSF